MLNLLSYGMSSMESGMEITTDQGRVRRERKGRSKEGYGSRKEWLEGSVLSVGEAGGSFDDISSN
jgi:hypothetical protein